MYSTSIFSIPCILRTPIIPSIPVIPIISIIPITCENRAVRLPEVREGEGLGLLVGHEQGVVLVRASVVLQAALGCAARAFVADSDILGVDVI